MNADVAANYIATVTGLVGAIGLGIIWWQVRLQAEQARTSFEDSLVAEYRVLIGSLKCDRMLSNFDKTLDSEELMVFFRYFDLCNGQAFLYKKGRISEETWVEWRDGMKDNFGLPAFQLAWKTIEPHCKKSFTSLRSGPDDAILTCPPLGRIF